MKDFCQYGNRRDDEWEILPWIPDPRPPFKIWAKPEQIAPFFRAAVFLFMRNMTAHDSLHLARKAEFVCFVLLFVMAFDND